MAHVPEQWGIPMYLVMSVFGVTSWAIPLQPSGLQIFTFWEGSSLQGPRALAQILALPVFNFFSSISFFSLLFSCCRWTITLWRWLWEGEEREEGQVAVWSVCSAWLLAQKNPEVSQERAADSHVYPVQMEVSPSECHGSSSGLGVRKT